MITINVDKAAKFLGIPRKELRFMRNADAQELHRELALLNLKSAKRLQDAVNTGKWIDRAGNKRIITKAEREKAPTVILRLVQSADAHLTMAGK